MAHTLNVRTTSMSPRAGLDADSFVCTNGLVHDAVIEALKQTGGA